MSGEGQRTIAPGTPFGRYVIARLIGTGGMAAVYEAVHTDLDKRVALKTLHAFLALRPDLVKRFVLEAKTASRIRHPHVLGISDIGIEEGVPFMAMELLEGEELAAVVHRDGAMALERVVDILLPVLSAVTAAHEAGVLHRDLKPENIFLAKRRVHGEHPVLLDFGISKVQGPTGTPHGLTAADELLGTPEYMSPEQVLKGMIELDARSDQYALGVVLYEMLTGARPFRSDGTMHDLMRAIARGGAPPPTSIRPSLPPDLDAIVGRAMSVAREDRFASITDLGAALLPYASPVARVVWGEEFGDVLGAPLLTREPAPAPPRVTAPPALAPADLRVVPWLEECTDRELVAFAAIAPARRVEEGATLFEEGAPAWSCFVVVSGELDVGRATDTDSWWLGTAGPGALLGQNALFDDATRSVAAVAKERVVVVEIGRDTFSRLVDQVPGAADRLLEQITLAGIRRLRDVMDRVDEANAHGARDRGKILRRLRGTAGEWSLPIDEAKPRRRA